MEVAHIDAFERDPERFWSFYAQRFDVLAHKQPNDAHRALAALERAGLLQAVVTQNVDQLHRKAGTRELVEVHGSIAGCVCLHCGAQVSREQAQSRIAADPAGVPRCDDCCAPLKPQVVLFGEPLPERALTRAQELCARADVLLCIGSSLEVYPVAGLPELTLGRRLFSPIGGLFPHPEWRDRGAMAPDLGLHPGFPCGDRVRCWREACRTSSGGRCPAAGRGPTPSC